MKTHVSAVKESISKAMQNLLIHRYLNYEQRHLFGSLAV